MPFSLTDDYIEQMELEQVRRTPPPSPPTALSDSLAQLELETAGQRPGSAPSTTFFPSLGGNAQQVAAQLASGGYPMQNTGTWISGADAAAYLGIPYDPNALYERPWAPGEYGISLENLFNQMVRDQITANQNNAYLANAELQSAGQTAPRLNLTGVPYNPASIAQLGGGPQLQVPRLPSVTPYSPASQAPVQSGVYRPPEFAPIPLQQGPRGLLSDLRAGRRGGPSILGVLKDAGTGALTALDAAREYGGLPLAGGIANAFTDPSVASTASAIASVFGGASLPKAAVTAGLANLGTDYGGSRERGQQIREDAYSISPGLGVGFDILTDPLTYVGVGVTGALAKKAPTALRPLMTGRLNPVGGLIEGVGPQSALPLALGAGAGAEVASRTDIPYVPEQAEMLGGSLLGGIAGLGAMNLGALASGARREFAQMPAPQSVASPQPRLGEVVIGGGMPPTQSRSAIRNLADVPTQASTRALMLGATGIDAISGRELIPNEPLLGLHAGMQPEQDVLLARALDRLRKADDPVVRPAMRQMDDGFAVSETQSVRITEKAKVVEALFKWRSVNGNRLVQLPDGSRLDIRDLAARLTSYESAGLVTPAQVTALRELGAEIDKVRDLSVMMGVDVGIRSDIEDGGVFLPRGRPEQDGTTGLVNTPRGFRGGKPGGEKGAVYDSVAQGIENGEKYPRLADAVYEYTNGILRANVRRGTAKVLSELVDSEGNPIVLTARDLMNPVIRENYDQLRADLASVRNRLRTAERRAGMADVGADELDRALENVQRGMPDTGTRALARSGTVLEQQGRRADDLLTERFGRPAGSEPVRIKMPVTPERKLRGEELARVVDEFEKAIPPDVDKVAKLETAVRRTGRRIDDLRLREGRYATIADELKGQLQGIEDRLDAARPEYQRALQNAGGRGYSRVDIPELSGSLINNEMADTINRYMNRATRIQGKGSGIYKAVEAVKDATFPVRLGLDVGYVGIHGMIPIAVDKTSAAIAMRASTEAFFGKPRLGQLMDYVNDMHARMGLPLTQDMSRNGLAITGSGAASLGTRLGNVGQAIRALPVIKQADTSFGTFVDSWRILAASNKLQTAKALGFDVLDDAVQRDIYKTINRVSGYGSKPLAGEWGQFFTTAPRIYQGDIELIGSALGSGGLTGATARDAVLRTIGQAVLVTEASNRARGYDTEYGVEVTFENGRPKVIFPPDWMAIKDVDGNDVKLLGRFDSLAKIIAATLNGDIGYAPETKAAPGVAILRDLIRGEDFYGRDYNLTSAEGAQNFARSLLPLAAQNAMEGGNFTGVALDILGIKAREAAFYTKVGREYFDATGRDYRTDRQQQPRMVYDFLKSRPDLQEEEQAFLQEAASRSGGEWAQNVLDVDAARAAFNAGQEARDAELVSFDMEPEEWRELRSDQLQYLRGQTDFAWRNFDPDDDGQNPLLVGYYNAMNQGKDITGAWDSGPLEAYMASLSLKDQKWIEENTGLSRELSPVEQKFREDVRLIAESGYWDIADMIAKEWASQNGFPSSVQTESDLYDYARNAIEKEMLKSGRGMKTRADVQYRDTWVESWLEGFIDWKAYAREQLRKQPIPYAESPHGEVFLFELLDLWGYKEPNKAERGFVQTYGDRTGGYQP